MDSYYLIMVYASVSLAVTITVYAAEQKREVTGHKLYEHDTEILLEFSTCYSMCLQAALIFNQTSLTSHTNAGDTKQAAFLENVLNFTGCYNKCVLENLKKQQQSIDTVLKFRPDQPSSQESCASILAKLKQEHGTHVVKSGTYMIKPAGAKKYIYVYCDMETDSGGWTVFQRNFRPNNYNNENSKQNYVEINSRLSSRDAMPEIKENNNHIQDQTNNLKLNKEIIDENTIRSSNHLPQTNHEYQGLTDFSGNKYNLFFNKSWTEYKYGFNLSSLPVSYISENSTPLWLGNDILYKMTTGNNDDIDYTIRVELVSSDKQLYFAEYTGFKVHNEDDSYRLEIGGFSKASEITMQAMFYGLLSQNNAPFSTFDNIDLSLDGNNCPHENAGGFWYASDCGFLNVNGNMYWHSSEIHKEWISSQMKFRPTKISF